MIHHLAGPVPELLWLTRVLWRTLLLLLLLPMLTPAELALTCA